MLQNIVFQDNIYQLSRLIDLVQEGLQLDLSEDFFLDKTLDDLLFFDAALQKMKGQVEGNSRMSDYIPILHSLYSCEERFIRIVDLLLSGKGAMNGAFTQFMTRLQGIRNVHAGIRESLIQGIRKSDNSIDSRDMVSQNELSELLNF
ncbi:MAG TPA: hypothetical protein PKH81_01875 [Treponemataceae bacterium]|nr:hypothetical protein [Treponemataceae bacterium]